ncbi:hypothetical protein [Dactylosporangium sp. NPDC000521]|uniref:hypothetical protein n=1 Tax=Dactylosporangium sp. NPDC000521 TaxID=3363975 RepID=UPI00367BB0E2
MRFARLLTGDEHRADNLVQEVLAKTFVQWRRVPAAERPDIYVRRMLVNANTSWWRDGLFVFPTGPMQRFYYQRWQPVPGVWTQLFAEDAATEDAARIRARVRLDTTLRCTAPVQLTALPAGAGLLDCETTLAGRDLPGRLLSATLWAGENTVDRAEISMMRAGLSGTSAAPTLTIAGHPAAVFTDNRFRPSVEFPDADGLRVHVAGTGTYTSPTILTIAEGIRVSRTPVDPSTWADRLVT